MSHIKSDALLNIAVEAGLGASNIIMEALDKPRVASFKGETDLVTETDMSSEKLIKSIISSNFPDHDILAEESKITKNNSEYLWVIDPLDGTTNFVHGYPSFSVSIGVYFRGEPVVAVVVEMPHKKLYSAIKNEGAWCEGKRIYCSRTSKLNRSLLVTGFPYIHDEKWEKNMTLFKYFTDITQGVRRLGSAAIDLCHIATGQADGFWELGLKPWDTAAGLLIAEEAGCRVSNMKGDEYNIEQDNILVSNNKLHTKMLREISKFYRN